jgi:hypothetical protein
MHVRWRPILLIVTVIVAERAVSAAPQAVLEPQRLVVTAPSYRISFHRWKCDLQIELRDAAGHWRPIGKGKTRPEFAMVDARGVHGSFEAPIRLCHANVKGTVVVGLSTVLPSAPPTIVRIHFLCTDDGLLIRFASDSLPDSVGTCWPLPRILLDETLFDGYVFWPPDDRPRSGDFAALGASPTYAGVSAWGGQGDTAARLSPRHPAIIARSRSGKIALGAVFLDYQDRWATSRSFLQRYDSERLFFYPAIVDRRAAAESCWAWIAPLSADPSAAATMIERLVDKGKTLAAEFRAIAPDPEDYWNRSVPDFPAAVRRAQPADDIRQAVVYSINETILSDDGIDLARKTGSDVLVRGWFKWGTAPDYAKLAPLVPKAHGMGALFGGGITCSALYHGESGLSEKQVRDMATRGSAGQLIDAWGERNCRHGTLSNPAYREFLLSSCKKQIDAGADVLFMDEINAALQPDEGFDDYSIADFRKFLLDRYGRRGWTPTDARWRTALKINTADRNIAPDQTMRTFRYRAYLKSLGLTHDPHVAGNPLANDWRDFREDRDDRAWKWLTDAIRAYAASRGRRVLINANGLARYVDLQVLGVWENWQTAKGRIDLAESQLDQWGSTVAAGWHMAGKKVPVVLFHDWGFDGFPWLEIPPEDRRLWIRVRGAEIYAAGGFFAFPVHAGNDCRLDGTLPEIARQSRFYHAHKDLYLGPELLGFEPLDTKEKGLSLALWKRVSPPSLILHVINREAEEGKPKRRSFVAVKLPTTSMPKAVRVVSPDWEGERRGEARVAGGKLTVVVPELEAYDVAILDYAELPALKLSGRRIVPSWQWARPDRNEFVVGREGLISELWALPGLLQGRLHRHLRNPPTFVVNMPQGGSLAVHVRGVATLGARLQWQVDGHAAKVVDLPDRDGKNDAMAREYDQTFEFAIPPGRHRVTLDNVGGDWACIGWYAFKGELLDP